jgi:hypothetical protein
MRWDEMSFDEMKWDKLRSNQISSDELRWMYNEMSATEMKWNEIGQFDDMKYRKWISGDYWNDYSTVKWFWLKYQSMNE